MAAFLAACPVCPAPVDQRTRPQMRIRRRPFFQHVSSGAPHLSRLHVDVITAPGRLGTGETITGTDINSIRHTPPQTPRTRCSREQLVCVASRRDSGVVPCGAYLGTDGGDSARPASRSRRALVQGFRRRLQGIRFPPPQPPRLKIPARSLENRAAGGNPVGRSHRSSDTAF